MVDNINISKHLIEHAVLKLDYTYVPYTGAVSNVDLGSYDFTTTGELNSSYSKISQLSDTDGIEISGYDDVSSNTGKIYVNSAGSFRVVGSSNILLDSNDGFIFLDSTKNIFANLGDSAGAYDFNIRNDSDDNVFSVNSLGEVTAKDLSCEDLDVDGDLTILGTGNLLLSNQEYIKWKDSGGTYRAVLTVGSGNELLFGSSVLNEVVFSVGTLGRAVSIQEVSGDLRLEHDNQEINFGAGTDASIYYDGTDLIINPKKVGSGKLVVKGDLSITTAGNLQLENSEYIKWKDSGGTYRTVLTVGAGNELLFGSSVLDEVVFSVGTLGRAVSIQQTTGNFFVESGGIVAGGNTLTGTNKLEVEGKTLVKDKIAFTQTDGNEYIDSLADGYMDYGATTEHRFNNDVDVDGNVSITASATDTVILDIDGTTAYTSASDGKGINHNRYVNWGSNNAKTFFGFYNYLSFLNTDSVLAGNEFWYSNYNYLRNSGKITNTIASNQILGQQAFDLTISDAGEYDTDSTGRIELRQYAGSFKIDNDMEFMDTGGNSPANYYDARGMDISIDVDPTLTSGTLTQDIKGLNIDVTGNTVGSSTAYGIYIQGVSGADNNYSIWDTSGSSSWVLDGDNKKIILGGGQDSSIYYDGTNLIINPKEVGSGKLDVLGTIQADGYNSSDGSSGWTGTFTNGDGDTVTVKNGLITGVA